MSALFAEVICSESVCDCFNNSLCADDDAPPDRLFCHSLTFDSQAYLSCNSINQPQNGASDRNAAINLWLCGAEAQADTEQTSRLSKRCEELFAICFANKINETGWHGAPTDPHVRTLQNSKITNKKPISFLYIHRSPLFPC